MKYSEFKERDHFSKPELLAFAYGTLVDDAPEDMTSRLPIPPMLMLDRVSEITRSGRRGRIVAERDVALDDWFFHCHFGNDPVQPGCLGLDGVWQLLGFFCVWAGGLGSGRALGCGEVEFFGQIRPHDGTVKYEVDVRRYSELPKSESVIVIGNASLSVDGDPIYTIKDAKVGLFLGIGYSGYPNPGPNMKGGRMAE